MELLPSKRRVFLKKVGSFFIIFVLSTLSLHIVEAYQTSPTTSSTPDINFLIKKTLESSYSLKIIQMQVEDAKRKYERGKIDKLDLEKLSILKERQKFNLIQKILGYYFEILKLSDQIRIQKLNKKLICEEISNFEARGSVSPEYLERLKNQISLTEYNIQKIEKERAQALYKLKLHLNFSPRTDLKVEVSYADLINLISKIYNLLDIPEWGFEYRLKQIEKDLVRKNIRNIYHKILFQVKNCELAQMLFRKQLQEDRYRANLYYYQSMQKIAQQAMEKVRSMFKEAVFPEEFSKARRDYIETLFILNNIERKLLEARLGLLNLAKPVKTGKVETYSIQGSPGLKKVIDKALNNSVPIKIAKLIFEANQIKMRNEKNIPQQLLEYVQAELEYKKYNIQKLKDEVAAQIIFNWYEMLLSEQRLGIAERLLESSREEVEFYKQREEFSKFQFLNSELQVLKRQLLVKQRLLDEFALWLNLKETVQNKIESKDLEFKPEVLFTFNKIDEEISKAYKFHPEIEERLISSREIMIEKTLNLARKGFWVKPGFYEKELLNEIMEKLGLTEDKFHNELKLYQVLKLSDKDKHIAVEIQTVILNKIRKKNYLKRISLKNQAILKKQNLEESKNWVDKCFRRINQDKKEKIEIQNKLHYLMYDKRDILQKKRIILHSEDLYNKYLLQYIKDLIEFLKISPLTVLEISPKVTHKVQLHLSLLKYPELESLKMELKTMREILNNIATSEVFKELKRRQIQYILKEAELKTNIKFSELNIKLQTAELAKLELIKFTDFIEKFLTFMKKEYDFGIIDISQMEELKDIKFQLQERIYQANKEYRDAQFGIKDLMGLNESIDLEIAPIFEIEDIEKITIKDMNRFIQTGINKDPTLNLLYLKIGYLDLGELSSIALSPHFKKFIEANPPLMQIRQNIEDLKRKLYLLQANIRFNLSSLNISYTKFIQNINILNKAIQDYKRRNLAWECEYGLKYSILNFLIFLDDYLIQLERYKVEQQNLSQVLKIYDLWPEEVQIEKTKLKIPQVIWNKNFSKAKAYIKQEFNLLPLNIIGELKRLKPLLKEVIGKVKNLFLSLKDKFLPPFDKQMARYTQRDFWRIQARKRLETLWKKKEEEQVNLKQFKQIENIFNMAEEKEYQMSLYLEKTWQEARKKMEELENTLKRYRILLEAKKIYENKKMEELIQLWKIHTPFYYKEEIIIEKDDMKAILSKLLDNYISRFKLNIAEKDEFIKNLILVSEKFNEILGHIDKEDLKIPDFFGKYVQNLVSPPVKEILTQSLDFNHLGLIIFYAHLISYSKKPGGALDILKEKFPEKKISDVTTECIEKRIREDLKYLARLGKYKTLSFDFCKASDTALLNCEGSARNFGLSSKAKPKFLKLDLKDIPLKDAKEYLKWERHSKFQLDEVTFSNFTQKEMLEARKIMQTFNIYWLGSLYGDFQRKALQEDIYRWIISMGINPKDFSKVFNIMNTIRDAILEFYPEPTLSEVEREPQKILLRSLIKEKDPLLIQINFDLLKESHFFGRLISLSSFTWKNKLKLQDINLLFEFMNFVRELKSFQVIFGKPSLSSPESKFYEGLLINFGKDALDEYNRILQNSPDTSYLKIAAQVKKKLISKLDAMSLLHNLESFKYIYGDYNLNTPQVNSYSKKKINNYLGDLTFSAEWVVNEELDDKYIINYFQSLRDFLKPSLRKKLEQLYKNLSIEIDLNPEQPTPKLRKEILGIYQSWTNFFSLRGYLASEQFKQALEQVGFIAKLSYEYRLNLTQDELKYWFVRKVKKAYSDEELSEIFKNMAKVREIFKDASKKLIDELTTTPLATWEAKDIRKKLKENIKLLGKEEVSPGEVQKLAEEVMLKSGISYQDLLEDYCLGIYIQACFLTFKNRKLTPVELAKKITLIKQCGFNKQEIANFIRLTKLISEEEKKVLKNFPMEISGDYPRMTNSEVLGFLIELFKRRNGNYETWIREWWRKAEIIQKNFYKEHGFFVDFSLLTSLIDPNLMRKRNWQIKRIVEKGTLSKESGDMNLLNLGDKLNLERDILRWAMMTYGRLLTEDELQRYKDAQNYLKHLPKGVQRKILKDTMEKVVLIKMNLMQVLQDALNEIIYEEDEWIERIDYITSEISQQFILPISDWIYNQRDKENKLRRKIRLERQQELTKQKLSEEKRTELSHILNHPSEREKIKKILYTKAKEIYRMELNPSRLSSLVWKIREGYTINQVVNIYIKNYYKIARMYKKIFKKKNITTIDNHLILYFSEQIGLGFLAWENLEEMFIIAAKIKNELKSRLDLNISIEKSLKFAYRLFYSGADKEVIDLVISEVEIIKKIVEEGFPIRVTYLPGNISIEVAYIELEKIIYLVSDIKNIEFTAPPLLRVYNIKDYLPVIKGGIESYHLKDYWNNEKTIQRIANRLKLANLSPAWWIILLQKASVLNKFVQNQLKTDIGLERLLLYLDSKWGEASQRLNLYELAPWYFSGLIVKLKISKTEELLNRAFKHYLEEKFK